MQKLTIVYFTPGKNYGDTIIPTTVEQSYTRVNRWLHHYFNLIEVNDDCDFAEVVQRYKPDGCLFDGLFEGRHHFKMSITSTERFPEIPRAGICRIDSISPTRTVCYEYLRSFGVHAMFVIGDTQMGQVFREARDRIFYIPWFIDPESCKDYHEPKSIEVLLPGNFESAPVLNYPWRASVKHLLLDNFTCVYHRHPGFLPEDQSDRSKLLVGRDFFQLLNRSKVTVASGGFNEIVVSKQIEIPACHSLLVTHDTPRVRDFGFRNFESCLMATPEDIVPLVRYALENAEFRERITRAGFELTHRRHTLHHRPQLDQWFRLMRELPTGARIIQPDLFSDLVIAPIGSTAATHHPSDSLFDRTLSQVDEHLRHHRLEPAEILSRTLLSYSDYSSEPSLRLCIIHLLRGEASRALGAIQDPVSRIINFGRNAPDMVDWAAFLTALLCMRDVTALSEMFPKFIEVQRREADLVRWVIATIFDNPEIEQELAKRLHHPGEQQITSHTLPDFTVSELLALLCEILRRNKLGEAAEMIQRRAGTAFGAI